MSISYKDLGLVNTKEMFANAVEGGYAIPAYNFNNMEQLQAIIQACVETKSPRYSTGFFRCPQICQCNTFEKYGPRRC